MPFSLSFENIADLEVELATESSLHSRLSRAEVEQSLATKYNFRSWKQLLNFASHDDGGAKDFLDLACLQYFHDDGPNRWQSARDMLDTKPALESKSIYHSCACGALEHVVSYLDSDPNLVDVPGGSMDWQPLLYACYSRLSLPNRSTAEVVRLLLERGADPNAYYMWGGQYRFTANDTCNWLDVNKRGRYYPSKTRILTYLFEHALARSHHEVIEVLLTAGVLLTRKQQRTAHKIALLNGDIATANDLLKFGLKEANLNEVERFVSACMHGDVNVLRKREVELRQLCRRAMGRHPKILIDAVNKNRLRTIDILLDLGWDINDLTSGKTALHEAAYLGRLDLVDRFVSLGADLRSKDHRFNSTPYQWALVNNQGETSQYLKDALDGGT